MDTEACRPPGGEMRVGIGVDVRSATMPDHAYKQRPKREKVLCGAQVPKNQNFPAHTCRLQPKLGEKRCRFHKQNDPQTKV